MGIRLRPADEIDLRWFVHDAPAAFGLRCGLGHQLERARVGQLFDMGGPGNDGMDRAVAALRRAKRVRAKLLVMAPLQRSWLFAGYCWAKPGALRALDRLGAVCLLSTSAVRAYERTQAKALAKARGDRCDGLLDAPLPRHVTMASWLGPTMAANADLKLRVMTEADDMLTAACRAWYLSAHDVRSEQSRRLRTFMPRQDQSRLVVEHSGTADRDHNGPSRAR